MEQQNDYVLLNGSMDTVSLIAGVLEFMQYHGEVVTDQRIHEELQSYNIDTNENFQKIRTYLDDVS